MTVAAPSYIANAAGQNARELERHSCIQFTDPLTGSPFDWNSGAESGSYLSDIRAAPDVGRRTMVAACTAAQASHSS